MKSEAIDTRTLVRTQTTYLCLDSQFNLPRFIIPVGINIYDVPIRKSLRRDVGDLSFHNRSCRNCSDELSVSKPGPNQRTESFFCYSEVSPLRSYSQVHINLSIDDEEMVRVVRTGHQDIQLLKIFDLCNFDCHRVSSIRFVS